MSKVRIFLLAILAGLLFLAATSGSFLIVNDPQPADVIVVLAGETNRRPLRGLELLAHRYAPKMLLDVPATDIIYDQSMLDLAKSYVQKLPQSHAVSICPISGLSTKAEAQDVADCLQGTKARRLLVVTSDYHTRRARSTFQHELRGFQISVASATDPEQFGSSWWRHRQWAKMNFDEWERLMWWEAVDRWH